jgi:hypothetical protein
MANCANKNSPEFKKLVRITNQSPEDVSIAIGMWQDHFQTDDFPDGITLSVMFNNRESYGGIDQYLNAMYRPVKKVDIDAAVRSLPQKLENITKALSLIVPGLKIITHDTQDSFTDAVVSATGKSNNQSSAGFYNGAKKEIHLNLPKMVERMSIEKRLALNTLEHEATHPILDVLEAVQPGIIKSLHTDLVALEKELGIPGKYTVGFAGKYNQSSQKEEAIVEFIADIASGNLDVMSLPKTQLQKIADFFVKMFAKLGINIGPYIRTGEGVFNLAKQIQKTFNEGTVIAGIPVTSIKTKSQIIGPNGALFLDDKEEGSHRFDNYVLAKKMKAAGKTPKEIKDASGWEISGDGKWRYEIPDIKVITRINKNTFTEAVIARQEIDRLNKEQDYDKDRGELIDNIEKLYNELGHHQYEREFNKQVDNALKANDKSLLPSAKLGPSIDRFSSPDYNGTNTAKLTDIVEGPVIDAYPQLKNVTISFKKGMSGNASWNTNTKHISINDDDRGYDDLIMSSIIHEIQHAVQDFEGFAKGGNPEQFKQFDVEESILLKNYIDGKQGKSAFLNDPNVSNLIKELDLGVVKNIITQFNKADIKEILRNKNLDAIEQYKRLAGEVEARNAQRRAGYTDEQRRNILLSETEDIAIEDQIFLFNANSLFDSQSTSTDPISQTDKISMMSEEGPDYVFFSYGDDSKFNTEPMPFMSTHGYKEKVVSVSKKQVYPLEEDPNGLLGNKNIWQQIPQILEKIKALGYRMLVANLDNKLMAFPAGRFTPTPSTKLYESNQVKNSPYSGIKDVNRLIALTEGNPELLRPFRNYSIELDNALINYGLTKDVKQFKAALKEIKPKETVSIESLISGNKKVTVFNDLESLQNNDYAYKGSQIRKIESVTKINPIRHSYAWSDQNNAVYNTIVRDGEEETTPVENKIKFSLTQTDNSESQDTPYDESIKFGNLVQDITAKIKEGISDIVQIRNEAGVDTGTAELFQDAFDVANIRAGKAPVNARQDAIDDMIRQLAEEEERVTAQAFYREWANLLDGLGINLLMLKQILPDEEMIKDKNLNQTWKRILDVTNDIGKFVSQTIVRGKKFEITDFEGNQTGYWNHAAVGFTDMLAYVQKAVEEDPDNKDKLMANVRKALKENGDDEMLNLLEVAIAASGETNLTDLSKIVRAGSHAGRVLNVIKRYIGGGSFGRIKTEIAAATIMAENDEELAGGFSKQYHRE